ncbi:MAG: GxxExxY protein [Planctomycetaceae bacterium]|nr:GxxExxY protein [Planctomycetaceae bacterium]
MEENELSHQIIGAAIEVHRLLGGPGLLEDVYVESLCAELEIRGIFVAREICVPLFYKGRRLQKSYRIDVLVGNLVVVEAKAVDAIHPVHLSQCLTHLRLAGKKLGLVINFGERYVKDGVHRVANGL